MELMYIGIAGKSHGVDKHQIACKSHSVDIHQIAGNSHGVEISKNAVRVFRK